jgi:hypothetical protein
MSPARPSTSHETAARNFHGRNTNMDRIIAPKTILSY